jgi:hypothetical protein
MRPRQHGIPGPLLLLVLLMTLPLAFPAGSEAQAGESRDRSTYLAVMATYFQVSPMEVEILLEGRNAIDELPVLLLLAQETGMSPAALSASRRGGATWMVLLRRFGLNAAHLHVPLQAADVDARVERVWTLYRDSDRSAWERIELTDEEVITLVHLKVLSRHHGVDPGRILGTRAAVGSWVEVPGRFSR